MKRKKTINETQAQEVLGEFADKIGEEDVKETLGKEDEIKKLFKRVRVLAKYCNDLCEIFELLRDRITGVYRETPWTTIAALTGALIYVLSPIPILCVPSSASARRTGRALRTQVLEFLVLFELVGAPREDPAKDGGIVHPTRNGDEVWHEVNGECQVGEAACQEHKRTLGHALVLTRHGVGNQIVGRADVVEQPREDRHVLDLVQGLVLRLSDLFRLGVLGTHLQLIRVDDLIDIHFNLLPYAHFAICFSTRCPHVALSKTSP